DAGRFLIDQMVASLPDGAMKTIARGAAPYVAAYLNTQLSTVAPKLTAGLNQLSTGLIRIADHVGKTETWTLDAAGTTTRTITGFAFDAGGHTTQVRLADAGLADLSVTAHATFPPGGRL